MKNPQIIAYYLPQFHPIPENDLWWGKGFTEWTNVGKAKPLFKGHYQPKVPADLGYYDLRLKKVREEQVLLAKEAGVYGFCYWHYWFGNGKQLLNNIIDEIVEENKPNFPFCLGWANESWKAKQWNKDGKGDKILIEQRYDGEEDYRKHFEYVKKLFSDDRYIRIDGQPFFLIYKPNNFSGIKTFIQLWNKWVKEEGIAEKVYFVANLDFDSDYEKFIGMGFDAVTPSILERMDFSFYHSHPFIKKIKAYIRKLTPYPLLLSYKKMNKHIWDPELDVKENVIPFIIPNWDHTPRSGKKGRLFVDSTPHYFEQQAYKVLKAVKKKSNKLIILKSWNEWAEGNYMEPDLKWGKGYINALKNAINKLK